MLNLIKKELLLQIRDKRAMFWMIVFPILMILILGSAFSSRFQSVNQIPQIKVVYQLNENARVSSYLEMFLKGVQKEVNVKLTKGTDEDKIKKEIKRGTYDVYVKLINDEKIELYTNDANDFNAKLIESLLHSFVNKYNAIAEVAVKNPMALSSITDRKEVSHVNVTSIEAVKKPKAMDYYAVTMMTMTILYGLVTGVSSVVGERKRKTLQRIKCSPVSVTSIYFSKLIGCSITVFIQIFSVFLFSKYVFHVYFGTHIMALFLVFIACILMAVAIGIGLSMLIQNQAAVNTISNIVIVSMVFLGGGYIPLYEFGENNILFMIAKLSPVRWVNDAVFQTIYANDLSLIPKAITICLSVAFLFILFAQLLKGREEV